jgi:hypothetical protein
MDIRKIGAVGTFAAGAALAFAPLAAADDAAVVTDPLAPFVAGEVGSMNAMFVSDATLTGVPSTDYAIGPQGFLAILPQFVPAVQGNGTTPFDFVMYGVNPSEAGLASDPGAYTEFNGALVNFDDAYNVGLFQLFNPTADVSTIPMSDLFGSTGGIEEALNTPMSAGGPIGDFLTDGWNDLLGFFGIFASA